MDAVIAPSEGDTSTPWDSVSADPGESADVPTEISDLEFQISDSEPEPIEPDAIDPSDLDAEAEVELAGARSPTPSGGGAFTIPLICLGIGLIALCLLIPAADDVRRLAYERDRLKADLEQLQKQVATNDSFLRRVADDATLAERLARRQLKMVPEGSAVLELSSSKPNHDMSPFLLVTVPPPAPIAPYRPIGGFVADLVRRPKIQLYLIGSALLMIASGLILSRSAPRPPQS